MQPATPARRHSIAEALRAALQASLPAVHGCPRPAPEIRKVYQSLRIAPSSTVHYFTLGGVKLSFHGMAYDHNVFRIFHLLKTDIVTGCRASSDQCVLSKPTCCMRSNTRCVHPLLPRKSWPPSQRQTARAGMMTDTPQGTRDALPDTGLFACSESQQRSAQSSVALSSAGADPWKLPNWSEPGRTPL